MEQARLYAATVEGAKTKKAVRFLAEAEEDDEGQSAILNHLRFLEKKLDEMERDRSRPMSPEKTPRGPRQASRNPSPLPGNRESGITPPARRFGQNPGRYGWHHHRLPQGHSSTETKPHRVVGARVVELVGS